MCLRRGTADKAAVMVLLLFSTLCGCEDNAPVDPNRELKKEVEELKQSLAENEKTIEELRAMLAASRANSQADRESCSRSPSRGGESVQLTIRQVNAERQDREIAVDVTVDNRGKESFTWDREFSVFMRWHVKTSDGKSLESEVIGDGGRDEPGKWESRFVTIEPGKSLSKRVSLTGGFREFLFGTGYTKEGTLIPFGYQKLARFVVPERIQSVTVQAEYTGTATGGHPEMGFLQEFGVPAGKIGLLTEVVASNIVDIPLGNEDNAP